MCKSQTDSIIMITMGKLVWTTVLIVICTVAVNGRIDKPDIDRPSKADNKEGNKVKGYEYLTKYGYLSKQLTKDDTDSQLPGDKAVKAIKRFQKFAGLTETGEIDAPTLDLIEKPRCGVTDPDIDDEITDEDDNTTTTTTTDAEGTGRRRRRYVVAGERYKWDKTDLTYKVVNYPGPPSTITPEQVDSDVIQAFKLWSDVTSLTFRSVDDESEADIRLKFGKRLHTDVEGDPIFDGPGGTLAHAFSPNSNWGATDGDAHFDEDETYIHKINDTHPVPNGVSFFYTVAHEIGHTLGLDHSNVRNSLMWPWGKSYTSSDFVLPQDDKEAIQSIYGANPNPPAKPTTPKPPPPQYCTVTFSSIALIRDQIYAFSNDKVWRFDSDFTLLSEPEGELSRSYFPRLPRSVSAGYERWFDGKIFFFKGRNYWVYKSVRTSPPLFKMYDVDSTNLPSEADYPRRVAELGFPKKITAALHVPEVGRTYLFKAKKVIVVDEIEGNTEETKIRFDFPDAPWFPTGAFFKKDSNDPYKSFAYLTYNHGQGADYQRFKWDSTRGEFARITESKVDLFRDLFNCP